MAMSVQNLWVAQKCAFIGKSAIFTFFWSIFFLNSSEKRGQTDFGRKSTLGSLRGNKTGKTSKKLSKNIDFRVLSPWSEPKVLLRPRIGFPAFF